MFLLLCSKALWQLTPLELGDHINPYQPYLEPYPVTKWIGEVNSLLVSLLKECYRFYFRSYFALILLAEAVIECQPGLGVNLPKMDKERKEQSEEDEDDLLKGELFKSRFKCTYAKLRKD